MARFDRWPITRGDAIDEKLPVGESALVKAKATYTTDYNCELRATSETLFRLEFSGFCSTFCGGFLSNSQVTRITVSEFPSPISVAAIKYRNDLRTSSGASLEYHACPPKKKLSRCG